MSTYLWQTSRYALDLAPRPLVMGIVNVTPDSFSDGGRHAEAAQACRHADLLLAEGADILDIGGESTRPGAAPVSEDEELRRILPVLEKLPDLCVSVDTRRPRVMQAARGPGWAKLDYESQRESPTLLKFGATERPGR